MTSLTEEKQREDAEFHFEYDFSYDRSKFKDPEQRKRRRCHNRLCLREEDVNSSDAGSTPSFKLCGRCGKVRYCSSECQRIDWKQFLHKKDCSRLVGIKKPEGKRKLILEILHKIRLWAIPYCIAKARDLGKGFLFIQISGASVEDFAFLNPQSLNSDGYPLERYFLLQYLNESEYEDVCKDNFEMQTFKEAVDSAIANSKKGSNEHVIVVLLSCGFLCVLTYRRKAVDEMVLVKLAKTQQTGPSLELNYDGTDD